MSLQSTPEGYRMFEPKLNGQCVRNHVPCELFCNQKMIRELKSFEYYHVKSKNISGCTEKNEMKPAEMNLLHHQLVIQLTVPSIWTNMFFGFAIILSRAKKVSGCT